MSLMDVMRLCGLVAAGALGGGVAAVMSRMMIEGRRSWLGWLGWLCGGAGAVCVVLQLMVTAGQPAHLLTGQQAWAFSQVNFWLGSFCVCAMWLSCLVLAGGGMDRLVHKHAADALAVAGRFAWVVLPTWMVAGGALYWLLPRWGGREMAGVFGGVLALLFLSGVMMLMAVNAMVVALGLGQDRRRSQGRGGVMMVLGLGLLPVQGVLGFVMLCVAMVCIDRTGQPLMTLLGFGQRAEVSLLSLMLRWMWLDTVVVVAAGVGGGLLFGVTAAPVESLRAMGEKGYRHRWWRWPGDGGYHKAALAEAMAEAREVLAEERAAAVSGEAEASGVSEGAALPGGVVAAASLSTTHHPDTSTTDTTHHHSGTDTANNITPHAAASAGVAGDGVAGLHWLERLGGVFPTRGHYAFLAVVAGVFVFYASLVPVTYQPLAWEEAVRRFGNIRFYKLGIDRRADLLANFVVVVPVTYLMMAAVCTFMSRWWQRGLAAAGVLAVAAAYVVAIEFTQEWFPPRTISLNDIQAGLAGALAGVILWLAAGDYVTYITKVAVAARGSAAALRQVLWLFVVGMFVYGLFPMDFTFSVEALGKKYEEGRIVLLPFAQGNGDAFKMLLLAVRDVVMFLPVGLLLASHARTYGKLTAGVAAVCVAVAAAVMSLERLPVFSAHTSTLSVAAYLLGGWAGWMLGSRVLLDERGRLAFGSGWREGKRLGVGLLTAGALAVVAAGVLLYPFKFEGGMALFKAKMSHFINWPFQHYYYAGEWSALSKVVVCMALFAGTGAAMRWAWNSPGRSMMAGLACTLLFVTVVGMGIELGHAASGQRQVHTHDLNKGLSVGLGEQAIDVTDARVSKGMVFKIGKVADVTDVMAYVAGAWAGWLLAGLVIFPAMGQWQASGARHGRGVGAGLQP